MLRAEKWARTARRAPVMLQPRPSAICRACLTARQGEPVQAAELGAMARPDGSRAFQLAMTLLMSPCRLTQVERVLSVQVGHTGESDERCLRVESGVKQSRSTRKVSVAVLAPAQRKQPELLPGRHRCRVCSVYERCGVGVRGGTIRRQNSP